MADRMAFSASQYGELHCPLPVLRNHHAEDDGDYIVMVEPCGEVLDFEHRTSGDIGIDGKYDDYQGWWSVRCRGNHVLVVGDTDGIGDYVEPTPGLLVEAFRFIADLPPSPSGVAS